MSVKRDERQRHLTLGLAAFESLRAEDEPWLDDCFVPPPNIGPVTGDHSVVVFGTAGSGKTAMYQHLLKCSSGPDGRPTRLIAPWSPSPLEPATSGGMTAVQAQVAQVFDTCAKALLKHLANYPACLQTCSTLARESLVWFIHRFSQGDLSAHIARLTAETDATGETALRELLSAPAQDILYSDVTPDQVAAELIGAIGSLGLKGVWVIADGLETWAELAPDELVTGLRAFLSTLLLFERADFSYKLFIPAKLEPTLANVSGLARRRLSAHYLRWDTSALQHLVEQRLRLATGREDFGLDDLCNSPQLIPWLEQVGPDSPREWLDQVKPLITYYLSHGVQKPIDEKTWRGLRRQYPPRLSVDEAGKRVIVGARQISLEDMPAKAYEILHYLFQKPGDQVVSKAELYFLAYRGLDHVPRTPGDKDYEAPKEYEGIIDTNLWRLRKAIEPDPSDPVLLVTVRGHGVQLKVRW